ncbi:MAG TPA: hypothetical protein VFO16_20230 [Pseudonocardiaceae bacterium]|nr:hypothetical protein [Pseudonocardiaceae bacterium]
MLHPAREARRAAGPAFDLSPGPHSLGPTARYVLDHAPCAVLLVWPDTHSG